MREYEFLSVFTIVFINTFFVLGLQRLASQLQSPYVTPLEPRNPKLETRNPKPETRNRHSSSGPFLVNLAEWGHFGSPPVRLCTSEVAFRRQLS